MKNLNQEQWQNIEQNVCKAEKVEQKKELLVVKFF